MPEYEILGISKLADLKPDGTFVHFYRVRFRYKDITDFVDIPESEYSAAEAKKRIEEKVREHAALVG